MNDIIVFVPHDIESEIIKKNAELLRIQQTNSNAQGVIIVGCPPEKEISYKMPIMTISELAIVLVDLTIQEVNEFHQELVQNYVIPEVHDIPIISLADTKKNNYSKFAKQSLKRFNQVKQNHKQIFFNRTKHK